MPSLKSKKGIEGFSRVLFLFFYNNFNLNQERFNLKYIQTRTSRNVFLNLVVFSKGKLHCLFFSPSILSLNEKQKIPSIITIINYQIRLGVIRNWWAICSISVKHTTRTAVKAKKKSIRNF